MLICDIGLLVVVVLICDLDYCLCVDLFIGVYLVGWQIVIFVLVVAEVGYLFGVKVGV